MRRSPSGLDWPSAFPTTRIPSTQSSSTSTVHRPDGVRSNRKFVKRRRSRFSWAWVTSCDESCALEGLWGSIRGVPRRGIGGDGRLPERLFGSTTQDRKSTRLNSSHLVISYAVFCL